MGKGVVLLATLSAVLLLFSFCSVSASLEDEVQKITHYAQEYETGNINYVQLLVYTSSARENLNLLLGTTGKEFGGLVKEEQIRKILGEPTEKTKWVWVEQENHEMRLDQPVPVWERVIFDGKNIHIRLEVRPNIFKKNSFNQEPENEEGQKKFEETLNFDEKGMALVYRLNFNVEFKRPEEQLDVQSKIDEIKALAQAYSSNPSQENALSLAKESVDVEKLFQENFKQRKGKCEDTMNSIFGSENMREIQKMLVQEIDFYSGDKFDAIIRLEMCDDCEWNWINLNFEFRGRARMPEMKPEITSPDEFKSLSEADLKTRIAQTIDEIKRSLESGDYTRAMSLNSKIQSLNEAWRMKDKDVWVEADKKFNPDFSATAQNSEGDQNRDPYYWIQRELEKRKYVQELMKQRYEDLKSFYTSLFSGYEKEEFYYEQTEWQKRLVEEFMESGKEICDNGADDNKDSAIDCSDSQCGGKICGKSEVDVTKGNETRKEEKVLYCIAGECKAKEGEVELGPVCGNHICEGDESLTNCTEDCSTCVSYPAINCSGSVIFGGQDANGCPLEPICVEETDSCQTDEECIQPRCGASSCIEGVCTLSSLSECREAECVDGEEKMDTCTAGLLVVIAICREGSWIETGSKCDSGTSGEITTGEEEPGKECTVKEDCGGENDVCSNGKCVTIPKTIPIDIDIPPGPTPQPTPAPESSHEPTPDPTPVPEPTPSPEPTGSAIFQFFRALTGRITDAAITSKAIITGYETEGEAPAPEPSPEPAPEPTPEPPTEPLPPGPGELQPPQTTGECADIQRGCGGSCPPCQEEYREEPRREGERHDEERESRCNEDCKRNCEDKMMMPCIDKCVFKKDSQETGNLEECKSACKQEINIDDCLSECVSSCRTGKWQEFEEKFQNKEEEHKMEKGVFMVGGSCRTSQEGGKEGFIWFGGWGEPFDKIQNMKNQFYQGGGGDWCKWELESLIKQRAELEASFNQEFARWFFEKYLANSADQWEQHVSGIFELYWKNVEIQMRLSNAMECLGRKDISDIYQPKLINFSYSTEYGSVEYWEELKQAKMPEMQEEMTLVSPYMKIWIFPPKEFIISEMKKAMKNHEFPGSPEEKMERENQEGIKEEEKEMIKQDKKFMDRIRKLSEKYGGNMDGLVQFKDMESGQIVFNLYATVNEQDIMKLEPMLPEEAPQTDVLIEIDFQKIYDLIYTSQKEMEGARVESPPWDRKARPMQKIKEMANGVKMFFKVRDIVNSAKISPEESRGDVKALFNVFFKLMMKGERKGQPEGGEIKDEESKSGNEGGPEDDVWKSKEELTGEIIIENA
jgi:hypothetical protein